MDVIFLRESFFNPFFYRLQIAIDIQVSSFYFLRVSPFFRISIYSITISGLNISRSGWNSFTKEFW